MSAERFRQIAELYHAAREGTAGERAALLEQADPALRREVESLLAQPDSGELPDRPVIENLPELLEDATVTGLAWGACRVPTVSKASSARAAWAKSFGRSTRD